MFCISTICVDADCFLFFAATRQLRVSICCPVPVAVSEVPCTDRLVDGTVATATGLRIVALGEDGFSE